MALDTHEFSFGRDDVDLVTEQMTVLAAEADGHQWINIAPDVDSRDVHTGSWFWRALSSRGPVIPKVTWFPAHVVRGRVEPAQVGVMHATGGDAVTRLADHGVVVPEGWVTVQDHTRRGMVFAVPPESDQSDVVEFAMRTVRVLSPFEFGVSYLAVIGRR